MEPTKKQLELLALHSTGMNFRDIGREVSLSEHTVHRYLEDLRARLEARNLYHAQAVALARGYLAVDGRDCRLFVVEAEATAAVA